MSLSDKRIIEHIPHHRIYIIYEEQDVREAVKELKERLKQQWKDDDESIECDCIDCRIKLIDEIFGDKLI